MALKMGKVVELYGKCGIFLEAKAELLGSFSFTSAFEHSQEAFRMEGLFLMLKEEFQNYLKSWVDGLGDFRTSSFYQSETSRSFCFKANQFKNKTELLSRQEQVMKEANTIIRQFSTSNDPVAFYDIGKRLKMKEHMKNLLDELKNSSQKTNETLKPMYHHKIEKQMKEDFFSVYLNEAKTTKAVFNQTKSIYDTIAKQSITTKNKLKQCSGPIPVCTYRSEFFQENYDIISKQKILEESSVTCYCHNLSKTIKKIYNYWYKLRNSLSSILENIKYYQAIFKLEKQKTSTKSSDFYESASLLPSALWKLFEVDKLMNLIKINDKNCNLIDLFEKYYQLLNRQNDLIKKMELKAKQYLNKISETLVQRRTQLPFYISEDKKFIEQNCKNEKYLSQAVLQSFSQFTNDCMRVIKQIALILENQEERKYEFHEVSHMLGRLTNQEGKKSQMQKTRISIKSMNSTSQKEKDQKIKLMEEYLDSISIFDKADVDQNADYFSCALGPKFLLHGRIYPHDNGIFYESAFNKKNIFFGKTRIFIPKEDISQINQTSALIIFPDIVEVSTVHGKVNFHALGARKKIFDTLISTYFPQNDRNEMEIFSQVDFNQQAISTEKLFNSDVEQPYSMMIHEHIFKNCRLNKFFRRYLSDDEFQIKGIKYQSFKTYLLTLVDALEPDGTPLTPQPPFYFYYKGQKSIEPEKNIVFSERFHTYQKVMPTIPFLSKGGNGFCQDKQIYYWISPKKVIVDNDTVVKGFSLTEGMCVKTKLAYQEIETGVKLTVSSMITFDENRSTNSLIKGPTISNLRSSIKKMCQTIQKYEKGKRNRNLNLNIEKTNHIKDAECLREEIENLEKQNRKLKQDLKLLLVFFVLLYTFSLMGMAIYF